MSSLELEGTDTVTINTISYTAPNVGGGSHKLYNVGWREAEVKYMLTAKSKSQAYIDLCRRQRGGRNAQNKIIIIRIYK